MTQQIHMVAACDLMPYMKQRQFFGDEEVDQQLLDSIQLDGIGTALLVLENDIDDVWTDAPPAPGAGTIISGHRRLLAARTIGRNYLVPVIYVRCETYEEFHRKWWSANISRHMTPQQYTAWLGYEYLRRAKSNGDQSRMRPVGHGDPLEKTQGKRKTTAEEIAQEAGVSERTVKRAAKAVKAKEAAAAAGDTETVDRITAAANKGPAAAARAASAPQARPSSAWRKDIMSAGRALVRACKQHEGDVNADPHFAAFWLSFQSDYNTLFEEAGVA